MRGYKAITMNKDQNSPFWACFKEHNKKDTSIADYMRNKADVCVCASVAMSVYVREEGYACA